MFSWRQQTVHNVFFGSQKCKMQNGHFRLLFHTPDNSSCDEMVMNKYISFVGTRASLIPNVSRRTWSGHCCSGHAFCFFSFTLAFSYFSSAVLVVVVLHLLQLQLLCFLCIILIKRAGVVISFCFPWKWLFLSFCSRNCCVCMHNSRQETWSQEICNHVTLFHLFFTSWKRLKTAIVSSVIDPSLSLQTIDFVASVFIFPLRKEIPPGRY